MEMRALSFSGFSSFLCLCRWEQLWCGRSWESLAKQWPGSTVLARWSFVSPLRLSEGVSFERQDLQPPHAPGACRRESIGGPTSDGWTRKPPAANCRGYLGTAVSVVTSPQENPPCCGSTWCASTYLPLPLTANTRDFIAWVLDDSPFVLLVRNMLLFTVFSGS